MVISFCHIGLPLGRYGQFQNLGRAKVVLVLASIIALLLTFSYDAHGQAPSCSEADVVLPETSGKMASAPEAVPFFPCVFASPMLKPWSMIGEAASNLTKLDPAEKVPGCPGGVKKVPLDLWRFAYVETTPLDYGFSTFPRSQRGWCGSSPIICSMYIDVILKAVKVQHPKKTQTKIDLLVDSFVLLYHLHDVAKTSPDLKQFGIGAGKVLGEYGTASLIKKGAAFIPNKPFAMVVGTVGGAAGVLVFGSYYDRFFMTEEYENYRAFERRL